MAVAVVKGDGITGTITFSQVNIIHVDYALVIRLFRPEARLAK